MARLMTESNPARFQAPSDELKLGRLFRDTRKVAYVAYALATGIVASAFGYFMLLEEEGPAPKPMAMEFIIQKPQAKKPFRMRKAQVQKLKAELDTARAAMADGRGQEEEMARRLEEERERCRLKFF